MSDIVEFLAARLDEDEAAAKVVEDGSAPWDGQWHPDGAHAVRTHNGHVLVYACHGGELKPGLADHIARHDPARVLREVEAKRRILALHGDYYTDPCLKLDDGAAWNPALWKPCETLKLLAAPYADSPDYDPAWRVE